MDLNSFDIPVALGFKLFFFRLLLMYCYNQDILFFRTRTRYGEDKEKFTYSLALVFFQCIVNALFAKIGEYVRLDLKRRVTSVGF